MPSIVRGKQQPLRALYKDEPERAVKRYRVRSVSTDLADPMHATVYSETADVSYSIAADPKVGGPGGAPTPGDLFLASLATCQDLSFRMVADSMGVALTALEVEVRGEADLRGSMMIAGEVPVGFRSISCVTRFAVAPGTRAEKIAMLTQAAKHCCIIGQTLRSQVAVETSFVDTSAA